MADQTIQTSLRTVRNLRVFFVEMLEQARRLASESTASDRGYFTSTEDDEVSRLVASYCQARSAALDLIHDLRRNQPDEDPQKSAYFLIGFATALILVDAARFLRDETEGRTVVRRKLNQPVPTFGIEGGTYDTVQRSLLGARNAWRLYQARVWYDHDRANLAAIAKEMGAEDLIDSIDALRESIEVSRSHFFRRRWQVKGDQLLRRLGRTLFQRSIYGIQKFTSSMMADRYVKPGHVPQIPENIVQSLKPLLRPGDVFVVRKEFALTNYFLPGHWPHAALHLGTPEQLKELGVASSTNGSRHWSRIDQTANQSGHCVLEAMKDGVLLRCLASPLASDSFVILRPQLSPEQIGKGLERVLSHEGKGYDFDFDFGRSDRLVCTEVVYRAFDGAGGVPFELQRRAGRPTLAGADLLNMAMEQKGFDPVASYIPDLSKSIQTQSHAEGAIRKVLNR